jgi:hypothetical protein
MTSLRQLDANRRNALKSTGPNTPQGKERSRCNAVRHGLSAETVIGALEDAEDYKAFEAAIISDYDAQSAVERELVLRLASLLWRLRRATALETGLFQIQAEHVRPETPKFIFGMYGRFVPGLDIDQAPHDTNGAAGSNTKLDRIDPAAELTRCFLCLANLSSFALDRLSRYEATLWRQAGRILFALDALDRRRPQERGRGAPLGGRQRLPDHEREEW